MSQRVIISTHLESELVTALAECEQQAVCAYRYHDPRAVSASHQELL